MIVAAGEVNLQKTIEHYVVSPANDFDGIDHRHDHATEGPGTLHLQQAHLVGCPHHTLLGRVTHLSPVVPLRFHRQGTRGNRILVFFLLLEADECFEEEIATRFIFDSANEIGEVFSFFHFESVFSVFLLFHSKRKQIILTQWITDY